MMPEVKPVFAAISVCVLCGCLTDGAQMPPGMPAGGCIRLFWAVPVDDCTRDSGAAWLSGLWEHAVRLDAAGANRGLWPSGDLLAVVDGTWVQVLTKPVVVQGLGEVAGFAVPGGAVVACEDRPEDSAVAHEWVHLWGMARRGYPDYDHADGSGWWSVEHNEAISEAPSWR